MTEQIPLNFGSDDDSEGADAAESSAPFPVQHSVQDWVKAVHPSWQRVIDEQQGNLQRVADFLNHELAQGIEVLPSPQNMLRALSTPLSSVRVIIIGQDPYPTPGHAVGLSFSVAPTVRPLPRSLNNILKEITDDYGPSQLQNGDLSPWVDQGVLLLNRVLSVRAGEANSHRKKGWEEFSDAVINAVAANEQPKAAILWGKSAQSLADRFHEHLVIKSAHPSPLSASRGFFGSRPFTEVNNYLRAQGAQPISW